MATKKKPTRKPKTRAIELDPTSDAALMALDAKMAASPDMPIDIGVREYASLSRLAKTIARDLGKIGIDTDQIELLARYAKRLKVLQANWLRARTSVFLSKSDHKLLEEAEALDAKFVAGGRWACRDDSEALAELDRIAAGSGLEDTLQDLRDEIEFWRLHGEELKHTDITAKDLKRAEHLVEALEAAAEKEGGNIDAATALELRNRCFWAADKLAKTIREGGRYAFRLQPTMVAKFSSRYRQVTQRRSRRAAKAKKGADKPANGAPASGGAGAPTDA